METYLVVSELYLIVSSFFWYLFSFGAIGMAIDNWGDQDDKKVYVRIFILSAMMSVTAFSAWVAYECLRGQ